MLDVAADSRGVYTATGGPGGRAIGYSSSGDVRWTHLFDGDVHTIAVLGGVAYVGGHFDRACRRASTVRQLGCTGGYTARVKLAALDGRGRLTGGCGAGRREGRQARGAWLTRYVVRG